MWISPLISPCGVFSPLWDFPGKICRKKMTITAVSATQGNAGFSGRPGHIPNYRVARCVSHRSGAGFQARLLDNQRGCQYRTMRLCKALGEIFLRFFQCRPFFGTHTSNCGDIERRKSAQEDVIYLVHRYIQRCMRYNTRR